MSKTIIGLNWKMNPLTLTLARELVANYNQIPINENYHVMVFVPCPYLSEVVSSIDSKYEVGVQDVFGVPGIGAYSGYCSANMLSSCGAVSTIIGHSETRTSSKLTEDNIADRLRACYMCGVVPVLCVGHQEDISNIDLELITKQAKTGIDVAKEFDQKELIIAFEPVTAIGTGVAMDEQSIQKITKLIKSMGSQIIIKLLYGGSVTEKNIDSLKQIVGVDGFLVGGVSLKPESLAKLLS